MAPPIAKDAEAPEPVAANSRLSAIDRLREATSGRMLQAALNDASATVEGDSLVLGVMPSKVSYLESERDTLAANALKAFGQKLRIVLKPGGQDEVDATAPQVPRPARPTPAPPEAKAKPEPRPSAAKSPDKAALKTKAAADPVVNRTLDLFGGTLLDVRPLAPLEAEGVAEDEDR